MEVLATIFGILVVIGVVLFIRAKNSKRKPTGTGGGGVKPGDGTDVRLK